MRTARMPIALAAILLIGAGCATADSLWTRAFGEGEDGTIQVENDNYDEMRVFVVRDGARHALGQVPSLRTRTFRLPPEWLDTFSDVRLVADALASPVEYRSEPFQVHRGQVVEFRIGDPVSASAVAVWSRR